MGAEREVDNDRHERHERCAGADPDADRRGRAGVLQQSGHVGDALRGRPGRRPADARGAVPVRGGGDRRGGRVRPDDGTAGRGAAAPRAGPGQRAGQPAQRAARRARRWSPSSATTRPTTSASTHRWSPTSTRWPGRCPAGSGARCAARTWPPTRPTRWRRPAPPA